MVVLRVPEGCRNGTENVGRNRNTSRGVMLKTFGRRPQLTIATAAVFCHRFYAIHSHQDPQNDRFVRTPYMFFFLSSFFITLRLKSCGMQIIATACLFLAGKVEETPKSFDKVVPVSYLVQHKQDYERAFKRIQQKVLLLWLQRMFPFFTHCSTQ